MDYLFEKLETLKKKITPEKKDEFEFELDDEEGDIGIVAFKGGKQAGKVVVKEEYIDDDCTAFDPYKGQKFYKDLCNHETVVEVSYLEVEPEFRGSGLGTELMHRAMKAIKSRFGDTPIFINASPMGKDQSMSLDSLINFYKKFGFKVLKKYPEHRNAAMFKEDAVKNPDKQWYALYKDEWYPIVDIVDSKIPAHQGGGNIYVLNIEGKPVKVNQKEIEDMEQRSLKKAVGEDEDYRMAHKAPNKDDAPLWDVTKNGVYPEDFYTHGRQYYGSHHEADPEAFSIINGARGRRDKQVRVYRAIPKDVKPSINLGDWVTITKQYAKDHGESVFGEKNFKIVSKTVNARDLFTDGNSVQEWGYDPQPYTPKSDRGPEEKFPGKDKVVKESEDSKDFLPEKLVMLDCEMTGVVPTKHDLLQVAMTKLGLNKESMQYEEQGEPLVIFMKNEGQPENDFHKKYLTHVFEACNKSDIDASKAKEMIESWLGEDKGKVTPCGDAVHCDLAFLYQNGLAEYGDIKNDEQVPGTFHYEVFDMNSLKAAARQKAGNKLKPEQKFQEHDALGDCRQQTLEMNLMLKEILGYDSSSVNEAKKDKKKDKKDDDKKIDNVKDLYKERNRTDVPMPDNEFSRNLVKYGFREGCVYYIETATGYYLCWTSNHGGEYEVYRRVGKYGIHFAVYDADGETVPKSPKKGRKVDLS